MLTSRKSEVSVEFLFLIGIILFIFVTVDILVGLRIRDINESSVYLEAQKISQNIANEINIATRIDGYYREFEIPRTLPNGKNYSVHINNDFRLVEIRWDGKISASRIMTENVSGSVTPGINRIRNDRGMIIIES
jgi:hypothetical protein